MRELFWKVLSWIVGAPFAVAVIVFSVVNRREITYDFWPLPFVVGGPAFLLAVAALLIGLLSGGAAMWVIAGRDRDLLDRRTEDVRELRREIARLTRQMAPKAAGQPLESNLLPAPEPPGRGRAGPIPGPYLDPRVANRDDGSTAPGGGG